MGNRVRGKVAIVTVSITLLTKYKKRRPDKIFDLLDKAPL